MNRNSMKKSISPSKVGVKLGMAGLAGAMLVGGSTMPVQAAPLANPTGVPAKTTVDLSIDNIDNNEKGGLDFSLAQIMKNNKIAPEVSKNDAPTVGSEAPEEATPVESATEEAVPEAPSEFANIGVSNVEDFVNIRSVASTDGEEVGKLYSNSGATILESVQAEDGMVWHHIQSGSVDGYVRGDYLATGNEDLARSISQRVATVNTDNLNVRTDPSIDAGVFTQLNSGQQVVALDESDPDWLKISMNDKEGFVSRQYVADITTTFKVAESKEEERARLAAEAEARRIAAEQAAAEQAAAKKAADQAAADAAAKKAADTKAAKAADAQATDAQAVADAKKATDATAKKAVDAQASADDSAARARSSQSAPAQETPADPAPSAPASGNGSAVVSYASQFVGNPYVYGGSSLTNGADCSGFVMSVYAHFGVGLPHNSDAMMGSGVAVSPTDMQPGDIVIYSGHVGIYAGGGQIVNALNSNSGICYSNAYYKPIQAVRRVI